MDFTAKQIFVTGASSGLGKEVALQLAQAKPKLLILNGRNEEKLKQVVEECEKLAGKEAVKYIVADYSKVGEGVRTAEEILKITKELDIFIQVHGFGGLLKPTGELSIENLNLVMQTNFMSVVELTNEISKFMNKNGSIVLCGSVNSFKPCECGAQYCSSKAALDMFAKTAAIDLGKKSQIRVNTVLPGMLDTPFQHPYYPSPEEQTKLIDSMKDKLSILGRIPTVKNVAHTFLFLASDLAADITGTSITVDCGLALLGA